MTTTHQPLAGKVALVTGSAAGMGRAYAHHLAKLGANIVIADINLESGKSWGEVEESVEAEIRAAGGNAVSVQGDLSTREAAHAAVQTAIDSFGRLDILVNNAGGAITPPDRSSLTRTPDEDTKKLMDANFYSALYLCQEAAPMITKPGGSIINIATFGVFGSRDGSYAIYVAAKAAVVSLTQSLAVELGPEGVRVNAVAPGLIRTGRVIATAKARGIGTSDQDEKVPLRRLGTPDDMVGAIEFFATDLSRYVTGELLSVDGGAHRVSAL
ncbi:SDR family oxidoreductase [Herbiconiux sp. CPCC 205716]|uniref:SDR family oxidoreductase n=1 Tax=Herbiconiux gentiana TaxID=2970912 RepID=A0ABT2GK26_9MICO|nr:SDR family oxidoreductase [Herbiconiux gentiana]MCS5716466.1 SDR family oxidoreductase [Herbiconiux gentiana]